METRIYSKREFSVFCCAVAHCVGWNEHKLFEINDEKVLIGNHYGDAFCFPCNAEGRPFFDKTHVPETFYDILTKQSTGNFQGEPVLIIES